MKQPDLLSNTSSIPANPGSYQEDLWKTWDLLDQGEGLRYFAKQGRLVAGGRARSWTQFTKTIENLEGWDCYVGLNPTRVQGVGPKARSVDVTSWSSTLIDIDPILPDADVQSAANVVLARAAFIFPGIINAISTIDSGRGYQLWLHLDPLPISDTNRRTVEHTISCLLRELDSHCHGCRVDPSCSDLSRVARCPGTINSKTGRLTSFLTHSPDHLSPQLLLEWAPVLEDHEPIHLEITDATTLTTLLPALTPRAAGFLTEGVISPGRHSAAFAAAASLREIGVPETLAQQLVARGALFCTPPLNPEHATRAVHNAYRRNQ